MKRLANICVSSCSIPIFGSLPHHLLMQIGTLATFPPISSLYVSGLYKSRCRASK